MVDLFKRNGGQPIQLNGQTIALLDRIPIFAGTISVQFIGETAAEDRGVALESTKGWIRLTDGRQVRLVHIWDEPSLPRNIEHTVHCPDGELKIWNIYRTRHKSGLVTVDSWTGNAGMIINKIDQRIREYACSSGPGEFDPSELIVRVSWYPSPEKQTGRHLA